MPRIATVPVDENCSKVRRYKVSSFVEEMHARTQTRWRKAEKVLYPITRDHVRKAALFLAMWEIAWTEDNEAGPPPPDAIRVDKSTRNGMLDKREADRAKRDRARGWLQDTYDSMHPDHFSCLVEIITKDKTASQWARETYGPKSERALQHKGMRILSEALEQVVVPVWY